MESSRQLSPDMIFEVLSRTSLQTLDSSRLVCKEWKSLTYDSNFVEHHAQNTSIVSGYFVQSMVSAKHESKFVSIDGKSSNLSLEFLPRDIKIEASSDHGIFVYMSRQKYRHDRYYVCKPSTKQAVALPNPKMRYLTQKVALVVLASNPLYYKIIRLSQPLRGSIGYVKYRCEIFDSMKWAWKESTDILLPYGEFLMGWCPAICARGSVHFLTSNDRVLTFEENSESYHIFTLPIPTGDSSNYKRKRLVKYNGRLGFTCRAPNGCLELWVMKKSMKNQPPFWKKRLVLKTQVLEEKEDYPVIGAFYNSDVAFVEGYKSVIFYKFKNSNMNIVKLEHMPEEIFAFRSDFEPIYFNGRS